MKHDALSVTAMLVLAAFVVERVTAGVLFLFSFSATWKQHFPNPAAIADERQSFDATRKNKLAYFVLAGSLVLLVVVLGPEIRVLHALDMTAPPILDAVLTWLLLVAGSDRIAELVPARGAESFEKKTKPIRIEGEVTLVEAKEKKSSAIGS